MNIENSLSRDDRLLIEEIRSSLKTQGTTAAMGEKENLPRAAVCAILKHDPLRGELVILLVKRKEKAEDPWSGHVAFPGGRYIEQDADILSTAAREVMEETGLNIREYEILGTLDEVIPSSLRSIRVTPFAVLAPEKIDVRLNQIEIERFFWIPLSYFRDQKNIMPYDIIRFGVKAEVPSYKFLGDCVIWGMTFRIIQDLINRLGPGGRIDSTDRTLRDSA